ncbi:RNA-guided endonuclease InsQ/TnpB family protein [Vulcanisaeta sp. JCM 16161]|uniref:RNA-guided endonuclease InsQ/TnpB family protein n=1 Tax=Vulcanisaeta sp. JCM 16161 TaxID=1295372 RepID=UPI00406BF69B
MGGLSLEMSLVGGIPTTIPTGGTRTVRVRLLPNGSQERKLRRLAKLFAKCWNEVTYERRRQFYSGQGVDLRGTYHKYYDEYKDVLGSANVQQLLNMNNEAWASFFELLKARRQGRSSPFIRRVSPPGYWKDKALGERRLIIVVRSDRYHIEPINGGEGYIVLKDFRMRIKFAGRIKWEGKQGRLVIKYESGRWFAYIPIEVGKPTPKSNPRGYVRPNYRDRRITNPRSIQQRQPIGREKAFIDIGLNNLFAVTTTNGYAILIKGGLIKSEYYWWKREVATWQSVRDRLRDWGLPNWRYYHGLYLRARFKMRERLRHLYRTAIRFLADELWRLGVDEVFIGYPYMVSKDNGNEYNTNIWWFRKVTQWVINALEEYGIKAGLVNEAYTSKVCSICGEVHENGRRFRGLYVCPRTGKAINADINASINIARKAGYEVKARQKIMSFQATTNGVKPLTPHQGANARDPQRRNPAL